MRKYAVVVEQDAGELWAWVPDLPDCCATGRSIEELELNIGTAIDLHLAALRTGFSGVAEPHVIVTYMETGAGGQYGLVKFDS